MKRLLFILSLLFAGVCSFAQEGPAELTFKNTRFVDGASKETLYLRGRDWQHYRDEKDGITNAALYDSDTPIYYHHPIKNCPNFGISPFLGVGGTEIRFSLRIYCRNGAYTAEISNIDVWYNPDLGILYGEDGILYEDLYNRKQLKMGKEIVEFLYDYTDAMFEEIYGYMSGNQVQAQLSDTITK